MAKTRPFLPHPTKRGLRNLQPYASVGVLVFVLVLVFVFVLVLVVLVVLVFVFVFVHLTPDATEFQQLLLHFVGRALPECQ